MTIAEARGKCKSMVAQVPRDVLIVAILLLASGASFGLGYLAGLDAGQGSSITLEGPYAGVDASIGRIVASRNGTKYYLPECAGVEKISDANKIWFETAVAAVRAGYAPAAACKGI